MIGQSETKALQQDDPGPATPGRSDDEFLQSIEDFRAKLEEASRDLDVLDLKLASMQATQKRINRENRSAFRLLCGAVFLLAAIVAWMSSS